MLDRGWGEEQVTKCRSPLGFSVCLYLLVPVNAAQAPKVGWALDNCLRGWFQSSFWLPNIGFPRAGENTILK